MSTSIIRPNVFLFSRVSRSRLISFTFFQEKTHTLRFVNYVKLLKKLHIGNFCADL